ncbi:MAG: beta-propeller fold lactonase family protein, partial [Betaproteobacteria bacterium]
MKRLLPALAAGFFCALQAAAAPLAYVANEKSGTISIIDTATDEVVGSIKAGTKPRGQAVGADGRTLYVSDQPANALLVVDLEKRAVAGTIDLGESPEGVSRSPDGKWVVVAVEMSNSAAFIDTASGRKLFNIKTRGENPEHAVFSP